MNYTSPKVTPFLKSEEAKGMAKKSIQEALNALKDAEDHLNQITPYPFAAIHKIREIKNDLDLI